MCNQREHAMTSRTNQLTDELCEEIDWLRAALAESQRLEKYWREEHAKLQNQCISDGYKTIGTLLIHALKIPERKVV